MHPGRLRQWVTLWRSPQTSPDNDGFFEALSPSGAWVHIEPLSPSENGRALGHLVTMRYHPQVTVDTRMVYTDNRAGRSRELFVRGVQDVDERHVELRLLCEEVTP